MEVVVKLYKLTLIMDNKTISRSEKEEVKRKYNMEYIYVLNFSKA